MDPGLSTSPNQFPDLDAIVSFGERNVNIKINTALVLSLALVLTMVGAALAADDGSIKVTNATKGQSYNAYLIFPASVTNANDLSKGVTYTATEDQTKITGFSGVFDTFVNEDGEYTITKKSGVSDDDVIAFIKANLAALRQGSAIEGTVDDDSTVTFDNLAYGYYYVSSSLGTLISVDTAGKDVTVVDKNESTPTGPDKKITDEDSSVDEALDQSDKSLDTNDAGVGSVQSFSVTFQATNWYHSKDDQTAGSGTEAKKVTKWHFKDTPTNLSIDKTTVKVTVNGTEITNYTAPAIDDDGVLTFDIPWVDDDEEFLYETKTDGSAYIPVVVTYDATVLAAAASEPAPNEVEITYDRDDDEDVELGKDKTTTYTYKFKVKKTDENDAALDGAEFQLFYGDSETPLNFEVVDGKYRYKADGTVTNIAPVKGDGNESIAEIIGLDNATYTLKEVVVPAGYTKAADTTVTNLTKEDEGTEASVTTITIKNVKGTELPSTGGIGTTLFYIIGGLLVVGAAVVLVARRKAD